MDNNKTNMFAKSHEDRRKQLVSENDYVADDIVSIDDAVDDVLAGESVNFLTKKVHEKVRISTYMEVRINDFITSLSEHASISKAEIINQFLIYAIMNQDDIVELREQERDVQKIYEKFIKN